MSTKITAADLAVGQVWATSSGGKDGSGTSRTITAIVNGRVHYEREDGWYSGPDSLLAAQFAEMANDGKMTLAQSPIPHPSALGDLYEACKEVLQGLELTGAHGSHWACVIRAAIAKAEGGGK